MHHNHVVCHWISDMHQGKHAPGGQTRPHLTLLRTGLQTVSSLSSNTHLRADLEKTTKSLHCWHVECSTWDARGIM